MSYIFMSVLVLFGGAPAWGTTQPACSAVLEKPFAASVARAMAPSGPGFAIRNLQHELSPHVRDSFTSRANALFDLLGTLQKTPHYQVHYDQLRLNLFSRTSNHKKYFDQVFPQFSLNYNIGRDLVDSPLHLVWEELDPVLGFLKPLIEEFVQGLPLDERPFVRVSSMDFRRYKQDMVEDEEPHADGAGLSLLLCPNGSGTILEPFGERIETNAWDLIAISNKDRALFKKSVVPTLHRAPAARAGRIFMRISFYYSASAGNAMEEFDESLRH